MANATVLLTDDPDLFRAQVRPGDLLLFDSTSWIAGLRNGPTLHRSTTCLLPSTRTT